MEIHLFKISISASGLMPLFINYFLSFSGRHPKGCSPGERRGQEKKNMCIKNCIKCEHLQECDRLMAWCSSDGCGKGISLYGTEYINTDGKYYFITKEQDFNNEFINHYWDDGKLYFCEECWEIMGKKPYESPIEEILGKALARETGDDGACRDNYGDLVHTSMKCQVEILNGKYRVDFLLTSNKQEDGNPVFNKPPLIIECDGHNFHEKTKEQARRDKQRDRECLLAGYGVMRFTGSEVYNNVEKCIWEIEQYFISNNEVA